MSASIEYEARFLDESPRRRVGAQCDFGVGWQSADDSRAHRVTWLEGTGELYVLRPDDRIVVLGTLPSFEFAEAIINGRPEGEWRTEWLQAAVASAPTEATEIAAVVAEYARRCAQPTSSINSSGDATASWSSSSASCPIQDRPTEAITTRARRG